MIIPILHFRGNCGEAIALYEKAFAAKAGSIITNAQFSPDEYAGNSEIAHAEMVICGQKIFLNDRFGNKDKSPDVPVRLFVMFKSVDELLSCYEHFKDESTVIDPFEELSYSKLAGNFIDKFGIGWGFMVEADITGVAKTTLTTERLILRRFTPQDEQAYADIMANPNVYRYLGTGRGVPRESVAQHITSWNSTFGHGLGVYAVVEQPSGNLIGHCGVRGLPCGRKEILYAFDESAWGKGYATEAAKTVLQSHNYRPLIAVSYPENLASISVIKKLGFRHVGQEEMFGKMLELFILEESL